MSFKLTIENPCDQKWVSMTQSDVGKYCTHCQKSVVDYTKLTDGEVIKLIEASSGRMCGRLTNQQLDRHFQSIQPPNNFRIHKILTGLMLFGLSFNSNAKNKIASPVNVVTNKDNETSDPQMERVNETLQEDSLKNIVEGVVLDAVSKEPLPFANVFIKDSGCGVPTDFDGKFKFIIPDSLIAEQIILVASFISYEKIEIQINRKDLPVRQELLLVKGDPAEFMVMGIFTVSRKKHWWQFWYSGE